MKGLKIELLGVGIMLLGLALSTNNFWGYEQKAKRLRV